MTTREKMSKARQVRFFEGLDKVIEEKASIEGKSYSDVVRECAMKQLNYKPAVNGKGNISCP